MKISEVLNIMAKKRGSGVKNILHKYLHDFFSSLLSSVEEGVEDSLKSSDNFIRFRDRWKSYMNSVNIMVAGYILIALGVAMFLDSLLPQLTSGLIYVIVGLIFILIAFMYRRFITQNY